MTSIRWASTSAPAWPFCSAGGQVRLGKGDVELPVLGMGAPGSFLVLGRRVLFTAVLADPRAIAQGRRRRRQCRSARWPAISARTVTVLCHNFGFACLASPPTAVQRGSDLLHPHLRLVGQRRRRAYGSVVAWPLDRHHRRRAALRPAAPPRYRETAARRHHPAALTCCSIAYLAGTGELAGADRLCLHHRHALRRRPAAIGNHAQLLRGQASAVYLFVITMVGLGISPTAVALAPTSSSATTTPCATRC